MTTLAEFVAHLRESGVAALVGRATPPSGDLAGEIGALDHAVRAEFPGTAPALDLPAAVWAAELLQRACVAIADREVAPDEAQRWLTQACPSPPSAAAIYSADLLLRHLPELHALARRMSAEDPVTQALLALCSAWPFSSVGVAPPDPASDAVLELIAAHPALRREYADRILARADLSRLGRHTGIDAEIRAALGEHPTLAPVIAVALERPAQSPAPEPSSAA